MLSEIKGIDIYLLDQILKGQFQKSHTILDAGCGTGRNMKWFGENGFDIHGCDMNPSVIAEAVNYTGLGNDRFKVFPLQKLGYAAVSFDNVICNAVLHFAESTTHFLEMMKEMHRVLKPEGMLFIRMISVFGLPNSYVETGNGRYLNAEGFGGFLLTKTLLETIKSEIGFTQIEPVKSVLVEEARSMTTLVLKKRTQL